ncbi:MAG: hypothetical protein JNK65_04580 [Deltaproteobacteria bacterium]|nr:hypothetical protein [Deltaproteobacteria bacterium]
MELDQFLFTKTLRFFRKIKNKIEGDSRESVRVYLESEKESLSLLAQMLTGQVIEILSAEEEGGFRDHQFYLPAFYDSAPDLDENRLFYIFRIAYLSIQKELKFFPKSTDPQDLKFLREQSLRVSSVVLECLFSRYPILKPIFERLQQYEMTRFASYKGNQENPLQILYGRWMHSLRKESVDLSSQEKSLIKNETKTEVQSPPREEWESLSVNQKEIENYTLSHSFEKIETLEEFQGNWRDLDGSDEMELHQEALQEVKMKNMIRCDVPTHSVYQMEGFSATQASELSDQMSSDFYFSYDEWDGKKKKYRKDFCKVFPRRALDTNVAFVDETLSNQRASLNQLRRRLNALFNEREQIKRLEQGEEPDLDAMVENYGLAQAQENISDRIYLSKRKRRRDLSVLVLFDLSLSTDAYVQNRRVLDLQKESILLFSEILEECGDRFQLDGFYSHTRHQCFYQTFKSFDESWSSRRAYLGAAQAQGYTRIGPALRHATTLLEKEKNNHKWILLLSDAKPNDYDAYEGTHGIEDVRQACLEAKAKQVHLFALALDARSKHFLPTLFGNGNFKILSRPELLSECMHEFLERLSF